MKPWPERLWDLARGWLPEILLGAVAVWMVLADGFRNYPGDPDVFYKYAQLFSQGQLPYRDFAFEYPPLDLIPMVLPYALAGGAPSIETYRFLLFFQNIALIGAMGVGVAWLARRGASRESWLRSVVLYGLLFLALEPVITWRVDTLVTALTVVALIFAALKRPVGSGIALGAAVMTKLYPVAMVPVLALGQIRNRDLRPAIQVVAAFAVTVALVVAGLVVMAGASSLYFVQYATERGLQVESTLGALALLGAVTHGAPAHVFHGFGTFEVESDLLPALGLLGTAITVLGLASMGLALWHRFATDHSETGSVRLSSQSTYLLAVGLFTLITSRIFSPQYIFWIVPFAALVPRPKALLLLAACLLTTYVYPLNYGPFLNQAQTPVFVVNARNAMLVVLFVWLIWSDLTTGIRQLPRRFRLP